MSSLQKLSEAKQEVFNLFTKNSPNGRLPSDKLGEALRSCGKKLTQATVTAMRKRAEEDYGKDLDFDMFDVMVELANAEEIQEETIQKSLSVFIKDNSNGKIDLDEFKHAMTTLGDCLTPQEVDAVLKEAGCTGKMADPGLIMQLIKSMNIETD